MWTSRYALAGALAFALPAMAAAQPVTGLYLGAGIGVDIPYDQTIVASGLADEALEIGWGTGFAGVLSLGYGFGNGFRAELEGSYRSSSIDEISGTDVANFSGGSQRSYGLMVNGLYDFRLGVDWVYPYLGVGLGYQWTELDDYRLGPADGRAFGMSASGTDGAFAYQAIVGAAFPLRAVPGLSLTAEYRFLGTFGHQSYEGYKINPRGRRTDGSLTLGSQEHSMLLFGLRYTFGGPRTP
jgi:opacity protein-like surface antigen